MVTRAGSDAATERSTAWLVGFTTVLTLGMAVSTIAQFAFGAMAPFIRTDLGISRTQLGGFPTLLFVVAACLSPMVGALTDRIGGRRILMALFAVDAVAFLAIAAAPSYWLVLAAVAMCGVAIAASNPATNLLIAHHVSPGRRGGVVGLKQSGVQIGSFLAGVSFPPVAAAVGWRWAFVVVAGVCLAGAVAVPQLVPLDARRAKGERRPREPVVASVRWLLPYALFMGAGIAAINTYIVLYAHEAVGLSEPVAGTVLAVVGAVGIVARILWGQDAERRSSTTGPLAVLAATAFLSAAALLAAETLGAWALWLGAVGTGTSSAAWNSVGMLTVIREAGKSQAGRASAHVVTSFYVGLLLMPVAFGAIVDRTGHYELGWILTAACFLGALLVALWRVLHSRGDGVAPQGAMPGGAGGWGPGAG